MSASKDWYADASQPTRITRNANVFASTDFMRNMGKNSIAHAESKALEEAAEISNDSSSIEGAVTVVLEAAHANGLPIPMPYTDKVATNPRFRVELHATVTASVASVVAFARCYRRSRDPGPYRSGIAR